MTRGMRRLLSLLPLVAFACGGSIGPVDPATLHIEGSYDLVVTGFVLGPQQPGGPQEPPTAGHPAVASHARIDIRKNGATYDAAVTPDFGQSSAMTVSFGSDGNVTLTGSFSFGGDGGGYASASDDLDALHVTVGNDGRFSGPFTAEGREDVFEGDVGWQTDATASGTIGADARAPQANLTVIAPAQGIVLPWDALDAQTSEPVDDAALTSALSLTPGSVAWQPPTPNVAWLGPTSIVGYRTIWSDFSGDATLAAAGGLLDPSGNASAATSTTVHYLDVPTAAAFTGATPPATWGAATVVSSPDSCGQAGSCVEIGPVTGPCGAQPGGIAGRIPASGATKLSITYRLRVGSQYSQPYWPTGLGLSIATPGATAQLVASSVAPTLNATSDPTYGYASDWTTAEIALPKSAAEVGFSLVPFQAMASYCGGELGFPPVAIVVDVVEVKAIP